MINVSRFVNTQKMLHKAVESYISEIKTSIKNYAALNPKKATLDKNINDLFVTFEKEYSNKEFSWEQVQKSLFESVLPIQPKVAHGGGDDLDYNKYQGGLRTISSRRPASFARANT